MNGSGQSHQTQAKAEAIVRLDGPALRSILEAGESWLAAHLKIVNSLNVFPVPDGDTGTNMVLTMRSALSAAAPVSSGAVADVLAAIANGALLGARGNSGVILSQFLQGLSGGLTGRAVVTPHQFALAMSEGANLAYQSVLEPAEGTMLTVLRDAAAAAQTGAAANEDFVVLFARLVTAARVSQAETPTLLPVLAQAGVTDSGGQGVVYLLEGGLRGLNGETLDPPSVVGEPSYRPPSVDVSLSTEPYGYDVQFLIRGEGLDVAAIRAAIDRVGWSTLVVGDPEIVRVHVHTHQPDQPLKLGQFYGTIHDVVIENMQQQALNFAIALTQMAETAILAIVPGPGLEQIFRGLGANQVLVLPPEMVTVEALGAVIDRVDAGSILLLPNDPVPLEVAWQAVNMTASTKTVRLVPAKTIPQGIAALIAYDAQASIEDNRERMIRALESVRTITLASSDQYCKIAGWLDNALAGEGSNVEQVLLDILDTLAMNRYEIMTIYFGRGIMEIQAQTLADQVGRAYPMIDIELYDGGQPDHHYIISLE